jgi:hypothetical protein
MIMSAIALRPSGHFASPLAFLAAIDAEGRRRQPLLWGAAVFLLLLIPPTVAALLLDGRTVNDVNVWVKPIKFEASLALYLGTLAWFFGALAPEARRGRGLLLFATASVALIVFEIAYIGGQSARGVGSHFNVSTPIEGLLFTLMGLSALVFTAFPAALGIAIARRPRAGLAPAFRLSLVLGRLLTAALGIATGAAIAVNGGHWVGATPTDAGGLPVFGWTRQGGDLRVAHFFGLHALQVLPLAGWLIARRRPEAKGIVWLLAGLFAVFTLYTLFEAVAGRPFLPFIG